MGKTSPFLIYNHLYFFIIDGFLVCMCVYIYIYSTYIYIQYVYIYIYTCQFSIVMLPKGSQHFSPIQISECLWASKHGHVWSSKPELMGWDGEESVEKIGIPILYPTNIGLSWFYARKALGFHTRWIMVFFSESAGWNMWNGMAANPIMPSNN